MLGLIAGSGTFPFEVIDAAQERGLELAVVAVHGNTDPALEQRASGPFTWIHIGELNRMLEFLKQSGAAEAMLAGAIAKGEGIKDIASLHLDERALALLARFQFRGDDSLLRAIAGEIESEGITVIDSTRYLADLLTSEGVLAGPAPDPTREGDLALGLRVARSLGVHDVGQSVVVKEGLVVAVEAAEGTDATIRRGAQFGGPGIVVVKAAKPSQDLRFDVPAIGPATLDLARECQVLAIGLEAGRTLVLDRKRTYQAAERHGISLVGLKLETS